MTVAPTASRISVGSGLARVGWTAMLRAAAGLAGDGGFAGFAGALGVGDLSARFGRGSAG